MDKILPYTPSLPSLGVQYRGGGAACRAAPGNLLESLSVHPAQSEPAEDDPRDARPARAPALSADAAPLLRIEGDRATRSPRRRVDRPAARRGGGERRMRIRRRHRDRKSTRLNSSN